MDAPGEPGGPWQGAGAGQAEVVPAGRDLLILKGLKAAVLILDMECNMLGRASTAAVCARMQSLEHDWRICSALVPWLIISLLVCVWSGMSYGADCHSEIRLCLMA